ncbi:deoxyribonuclease IV [Gallibacter intestinalis]|uniref:Probable endonuclease 4 n=1 Tax=Gallibacter intestinalis TaxID=2779356 RepID=A0ABR9QXK4_9FIRM|nr:deoxyribonuclease IV [Gallibacter intestinalis]MBE5035603.1 deoxyribonuclease IV [Gallibacter intestinalis]
MLNIGCHLSAAGGFTAMGKDAIAIGANTFAFFTRNPRGGKSKAIDEKDVKGLLEIMEGNGFAKLVAHAPYTLNPCSSTEKVREFAKIAMTEDLQKMEYLPGNYYNFHPGSHTGQGTEKGIELITKLLNEVLTEDMNTVVLLESMAGKGSEIGGTFEELAEIIRRVELKDKIGVCLDSCHISDGGYDIKANLDGVIEEFDKIVGLKYLKAMHLNDSLNPLGAHKDRHAKIGEGYLGTETFEKIINHEKLKGLPFILETPNELEGYAAEIATLRSLYKY